MSKEFYGIKFHNIEGYWLTSRGEVEELISEFLKSWNYMMDRVVFQTENPDSELMDEITDELMKWEKRLK